MASAIYSPDTVTNRVNNDGDLDDNDKNNSNNIVKNHSVIINNI